MQVTGKQVEAARKARGWKQEDLGKKIPLGRPSVSRLENSLSVNKKMIAKLDRVFGGQSWRMPETNKKVSLEAMAMGIQELSLENLLTIALDHEQRLEEIEITNKSGALRFAHEGRELRRKIHKAMN